MYVIYAFFTQAHLLRNVYVYFRSLCEYTKPILSIKTILVSVG